MTEKWVHRKNTTFSHFHIKLCVEVYFENILYIIQLYISPNTPHFLVIFSVGIFRCVFLLVATFNI